MGNWFEVLLSHPILAPWRYIVLVEGSVHDDPQQPGSQQGSRWDVLRRFILFDLCVFLFLLLAPRLRSEMSKPDCIGSLGLTSDGWQEREMSE